MTTESLRDNGQTNILSKDESESVATQALNKESQKKPMQEKGA